MVARILARTDYRDNIRKNYSFNYETIPSPMSFAKTQAIQGLRSSVSEMVDAIEQDYVPFSRGKEYLKQLVKVHNQMLLKGGGNGITLLDLDEVISRIDFFRFRKEVL